MVGQLLVLSKGCYLPGSSSNGLPQNKQILSKLSNIKIQILSRSKWPTNVKWHIALQHEPDNPRALVSTVTTGLVLARPLMVLESGPAVPQGWGLWKMISPLRDDVKYSLKADSPATAHLLSQSLASPRHYSDVAGQDYSLTPQLPLSMTILLTWISVPKVNFSQLKPQKRGISGQNVFSKGGSKFKGLVKNGFQGVFIGSYDIPHINILEVSAASGRSNF
jgi:hypothetical protein